MTPFTETKM